MNSRSRIHMLTVAASALGNYGANQKLVADLRATAEELAERIRDGAAHDEEAERRIERQRTLFTMLPECSAKDRFKEALLQRAYDLMWDGQCTECDAVQEFLPYADVQAMFDAWENDSMGREPKSRFYRGEI